MRNHAIVFALCATALFSGEAAKASSGALGVWVDHTGRGAVEISECGANLCGRLVWLKDESHKKGCGIQIIGNAKPVGGDRWDGGWILDPEKNAKYSVELKPVGSDKLRVLGYMGSKLFSETMIWKRAAPDLKRCDDAEPRVTATPTAAEKPNTTVAAEDNNNPPKARTTAAEKKAPRISSREKTAQQPMKASGCKKYFAQTGELVPVPCER
jgi:uncharacterized protein (DUF2147 family)